MAAGRIVVLAVLTQAALMALALVAAYLLDLSFPWGSPLRDAGLGVLVAALIAGVNYLLLGGRDVAPALGPVRDVVDEVLMPLFSRLGAGQIVVVAAAAGVGEELLFRGVVQPVAGLAAASALFGAAHVASRSMVAFGAWAAAMGLVLGALAEATGGLTAPIVAHATYDLLALAYLRHQAAVREEQRPLRV